MLGVECITDWLLKTRASQVCIQVAETMKPLYFYRESFCLPQQRQRSKACPRSRPPVSPTWALRLRPPESSPSDAAPPRRTRPPTPAPDSTASARSVQGDGLRRRRQSGIRPPSRAQEGRTCPSTMSMIRPTSAICFRRQAAQGNDHADRRDRAAGRSCEPAVDGEAFRQTREFGEGDLRCAQPCLSQRA